MYSVTGGGWTFDIPGPYHNHPGYWCNDPYALADFRKFIKARYNNVKAVNNAWGTSYASLDEVDYPGYKEEFENFLKKIPEGNPQVRRRWLDFIDWYRAAMTRFADWWLAATRKYFPNTPIYLCAGGDGSPSHGANFAEQCRVAAKHKAGVRITNESSFYPTNVSLTRWVASAGKHYGAYYGFEPAGAIDEIGIMVRIYNATASGANQLHDYSGNITNSEETIKAQRKNIKYLYKTKPIVPVALWYPDVHLMLSWGEFLSKSNKMRDYTDFDFVDESMLRTGALKRYDVLLIIHGTVMETKDAKLIAKWIESGGRVFVVDVPKFESVEKTLEPETILFGNSPEGRKYGKGGIRRVQFGRKWQITCKKCWLKRAIPNILLLKMEYTSRKSAPIRPCY